MNTTEKLFTSIFYLILFALAVTVLVLPGYSSVKNQVFVYPNPSNDQTTPTLHIAIKQAQNLTASIYDLSGNLLYSKSIQDKHLVSKNIYKLSLNDSKLTSGVYLVVVNGTLENQNPVKEQFRFTVVK